MIECYYMSETVLMTSLLGLAIAINLLLTFIIFMKISKGKK